jgi:cobalt-zinc-cadmium efflux system membrane fusion protein
VEALDPGALPEGALPEGHIPLSAEEMATVGLETAVAEARTLASRLEAMGTVLADQHRTAIVSYPFSARIASIETRVGNWVSPGQPLVVLQSEEVGTATSEYYKAKADFELATVNFERETALYESGVGARKNYSSAEAQLQVATATLDAAEKKLHVLGFDEDQIEVLSETHQINPIITLFAPIAGKVITLDAVLGANVDEATEILTIMDPSRLWVEAEIYEKDIARVRVGQGVEVSVTAYPAETFPGSITYVSDVVDLETRTITVRTEVANREGKLKPGMFAALTIEVAENGTSPVLPSDAVLDDGGRHLVFIQVEEGSFEPRHVTVGIRADGFVEVLAGLQTGEEVVTRGNFQLKSKLYEAVLEAGHVH